MRSWGALLATRLGFGLGLGVVLISGRAAAAPQAAPATQAPAAQSTRSYTQSALTKIRPGSLLRFDRQPGAAAPEGRTDLGVRVDSELQRHFTRVAELDVIAELAERPRSVALLERVEQARRSEGQRYVAAMQALRRALQALPPGGGGAAAPGSAAPPAGPMYRRAAEQARRTLLAPGLAAELARIEADIEREREAF